MAQLKQTTVDGLLTVEGNANVRGELIETGITDGDEVSNTQGLAIAEVLVVRTDPIYDTVVDVPNEYTGLFLNEERVPPTDIDGDYVYIENARWIHGKQVDDTTRADNYVLRYDATSDQVQYADLNAVIADMPEVTLPDLNEFTTDDLVEGNNNQYYTTTRVRNDISSSGDLSYDAGTGVFSVTTYKSSDFDSDFGGKSTDELSEGTTNLYFTQDRVRDAVSAGDDLSYDATTGVFSVTTYKSTDFDGDFDDKSTTDLSEGINLYFTNQRVYNLLGATGDLSYDGAGQFSVTTYKSSDFDTDFGSKSTDELSEGTTNLYYTNQRVYSILGASGDLTYDNNGQFSVTTYKSGDFDADFSGKTTTDLTEGTNLYFTQDRARGSLGAGGDLTYNNTTGVFSVTTYKSTDFDSDFDGKSTDELGEGTTNIYFQNDRARSAVSAGGDLSYNVGTGVFSVTTYKSTNFDTDFGGKTTTDLDEGTNLYFTNARAQSAIAAQDAYLANDGDTATGNYTFSGNVSVGNLQLDGNTLSSTDTDGNINLYPDGAGIISVNTDIIPTVDNTYSLGSANFTFKDVYIGPGSLYINGRQVISEEADTMRFTTDPDQNLSIVTNLNGILQLTSEDGNIIFGSTGSGNATFNLPIVVGSGNKILSSDGNAIVFGEDITFDSGSGIDASHITGTLPEAQFPDYADLSGTRSGLFAIGYDETNTNYVQLKNANGELQVRNYADNNDASLRVQNLTVNGTVTQINSQQVAIADNVIELNTDVTGTPTEDAGIAINRGDVTSASLIWDETSGIWKAGLFASETQIVLAGDNISLLTNDANYLANGDSVSSLTNDANYLSQNDNVSLLNNDANYVSSGDNISALANDANYLSNGDNVSTLTNDANYVSSGDNISTLTNNAGFITDISGFSTSDLDEGNNLYYTDVRVSNQVNSLLSDGKGIGIAISVDVDLELNDLSFYIDFSEFTTDDLVEGNNNLFITNERVDDRVSSLLVGGNNVTLNYNDSAGTLTINSSYTNTTYSAGNGLNLSGTTFSHDDTSSAGDVNNSGATVLQDLTVDGYGHVTAHGSVTITPAVIGAAEDTHNHGWDDLTTGVPSTATRWPAWSEVTSKPTTFTPEAHTHPWTEVTGKPDSATRWPAWGEVTSKPSTFTPESHNHPWTEVTGKPDSATRWPAWAEVTSKPASATRWPTWGEVTDKPNIPSFSGYDVGTTARFGVTFTTSLTPYIARIDGTEKTRMLLESDNIVFEYTNTGTDWADYFSVRSNGLRYDLPDEASTTNPSTNILLVNSTDFSYKGNDVWHAGNYNAGSMGERDVTISSSTPSGGSDGDVWFQI